MSDSPWNSPGQNTGVGSLSLLQGNFPTQRSHPGLPHCKRILYQLIHKGSLRILKWVAYPFSRGSSRPRNWTGVSCTACRWILYQLSYEGSHGITEGSLPLQNWHCLEKVVQRPGCRPGSPTNDEVASSWAQKILLNSLPLIFLAVAWHSGAEDFKALSCCKILRFKSKRPFGKRNKFILGGLRDQPPGRSCKDHF